MKISLASKLGMLGIALSLSASPLLAAGKNSAKAAKVEQSCTGPNGEKLADIKSKDKCVAPNKWGKMEKTAKTVVAPASTEKK